MPLKRNRRIGLRLVAAAIITLLVLPACGRSDAVQRPAETGTADASTASPPSTATRTPGVDATPGQAGNAALLLEEGRYDEAAAAYIQVSRATSNPEARADALVGLGVALAASRNPVAAMGALREARAAAPTGSHPFERASYLLGLRLNDAGQPSAAAETLRALAERPAGGPLQPYILMEYARALSLSGTVVGTDAAWAAAAQGAPSGIGQAAARAQAALAQVRGDAAAEVAALGRLVALTGAAGDRLQLAAAARNSGDTPTAIAQLRAIVEGSPGSAAASAAIEQLAEMGTPISPAVRGYVWYRRGELSRAAPLLEEAFRSTQGQSGPGAAYATFYLAAVYEDQGRRAEAVALYDTVPALDPGSPYAHRAQYWAARTTEALGDLPGAASRYSQLAANGPRGEFTAEAAFRAGYTLFRGGDAQGALRAWGDMGANLDARAWYWKGRVLEQTGDPAGARTAFQKAADLGPLDFYGIEAARRTGARGPVNAHFQERQLDVPVDWTALEAWVAGWAGGAATAVETSRVQELVACGLRDEAAAELRGLAAPAAGPWTMLAAARAARDFGFPDIAAGLASRLKTVPGASTPPRALLRLLYPVRYVALLNSETREQDVDPLVAAALIRQESFWDPMAHSPADAFGLTQVIPPTGEAIAEHFGIPNFSAADLYRPGLSLRFGVYYLGEQLRRYQSPTLAFAAYNAGPVNAERWSRATASAEAADIVEVIDIAETRDYVIRIFEHLAHYEAAYP